MHTKGLIWSTPIKLSGLPLVRPHFKNKLTVKLFD